MFSFTKKIALAASFLALYSWQFAAFATNSNNDVDGAENDLKRLALAASPAQSASTGIQHDEFFPGLPKDLKRSIANLFLEQRLSPHYAWVCKSWCRFFLGTDNIADVTQTIIPSIKSGGLISPEPYLRLRLRHQDVRTLENGVLQYRPEGGNPIDVSLSTMLDTNGNLVFPAAMGQVRVGVTWNLETFLRLVGANTQNTLVYLVALADLKHIASQISADASFIQNVAQADLSQNAVCALIRYGGDNISEWGFRYTILKYREMSGLSIWQIYAHEKAAARAIAPCVVGVASAARGPWFIYLSFLNRNDL